MELPPDSLYIKYVRLKEEGETPQTYPYTVPALANFRRLEFRRPVTFIMGENGMGKSTLLEAIAVKADSIPKEGPRTSGSQRAPAIRTFTNISFWDAVFSRATAISCGRRVSTTWRRKSKTSPTAY